MQEIRQLSLKTRNRLFYWIEQWHFGERHEEFVDAGFEDYGYESSVEEDDWERCHYQNLAYWQGFKSELNLESADTLRRLCPILSKALSEMDDWPSKAEFVGLLERDGYLVDGHKVTYSLATVSPKRLREVANEFDLFTMRSQLARMDSSIDTDPSLAIGSAKELIETCCKTILSERGAAIDAGWGVPQLVKATVKELKLTPDDIPEPTQDTANARKAVEAMTKLLAHLASIAGNMAELRNAVGTGHGPDGRTRGPKPRHARLAVNATTALVMFLFETHMERPQPHGAPVEAGA